MIEALNMSLETVRTVLSNDVNEIYVCEDLKRKSGVFYTVISITSAPVRLMVAGALASDDAFKKNRDFIGSFSHGDSLCLVFLYIGENLLQSREAIYADTFIKRKQIAENLLVALAETQITGSMGLLLLAQNNINITQDLSVYFNYFMDFAKWEPNIDVTRFYLEVATMCADILSREYQIKYEGNTTKYPGELQVLAKKAEMKSFTSFNSILTFIKQIPDIPSEPSVGIRKLIDKLHSTIDKMRKHSTAIFLAAIVIATLVFTLVRVTEWISYNSQAKKGTTYIGMENIGEVYLGDENV
ncbi:MAG: hypothetical protein RSA78_03730 [Oscillospiraceae bacterium]